MAAQEPTIASVLRHLAAEHHGPVEERRVLDQVLQRRPSSAKNPYATIRERLRWDGLALGWLRLSRNQLMPLHVALGGLRFRCVPRSRDVAAGLLPLAHLQPFAGLRGSPGELRAADGASLRLLDGDEEAAPGDIALPAFDLADWYARSGFAPGDSILVTVASAAPLALQIEREPQAEFRPERVAAQDAELLAAIVERVARSSAALMPCDEVVLPIFATAAWRAGYPGSPWQHLVTADGRLQLVDDIFLSSQRIGSLHIFTSEEVFMAVENGARRAAADEALLGEIDGLQRELRRARQRDADEGLWSGQIQRASATYGSVGRERDWPRSRRDLLDALEGYGESDDLEWGAEEHNGWESEDPLEDALGLGVEEQGVYAAARERMLSLLPPDVVERLQRARPEEAELLIAQHLNMLLARAPELFPPLEVEVAPDPGPPGLELDVDWQEADDDWVDDLDDLPARAEDDVFVRSGDLIGQFHDYLCEIGKSKSTARARTRALHVYADFLASYYGRTLAEGDYATLDECMFFYYPCRALNTSPRQAREICTAIKQFYGFLMQRGVISDDRFARALWQRRNQAAQVVAIYERISSDSPNFELLFERLFRPYTE